MRRSFACALLLASALTAGAAAQEPALLADLNPNTNPNTNPNNGQPGAVGSRPRQLTALPGKVVFITGGEDPADPEYRLWATDGTAGGTEVIAILCNLASCQEPQRLGRVSNLVFFQVTATEGRPALNLWRTDGTRAGTFPVSPPLYPDFTFGGTGVVAGGRLLFRACEDGTTSSCGLWSTDGSAAGTRKVTDLQTGMIASTGRRIVFTAFDATGSGLWVSDGTPRGTELVLREEVRQGMRFLTASGSKVFFMAGDGDYPSDLWVSDGTKAGTRRVEKFNEPFHRLPPNTDFLKPVPGGIVFVGNARSRPGVDLWRSDGTPKGTRPLTAFQDNSGLGQLREDQIAVVGDRVFFMVFGTTGPRLWTTRGNPRTAGPVTGCPAPGGCPALSAGTPLAVAGNRVVFEAKDTAHGTEPWTSDGTGAGTRLLRDLCPGPCGSDSNGFVAHAGIVDFRSTWGNVTRLVRTDGRTSVILARLAPPPPPDPDNSFNYVPPPLDLADLSGKTFFAGLDPFFGQQPWVTDGTRPGTRRIDVLEGAGGSSNPRNFLPLGNQLLFTASDGTWHVLYGISPSGVVTRLAETSVPASEPGPSELTESGLYAYYVTDHGDEEELWRTDGTPGGTVRVASFQDKTLSNLRDLGNRLLFLVSSTTGEQPVHSFWESNGTPAGTVERFDLPTDTVAVTDVTAVGAEIYFLLHREGASQVFRGDGTAAGTRMVLQLACDCTGLGMIRFLRFRGSVYFTAWGDFGLTLYRTDGTAEGTVQVVPAPGDPQPQGLEPQALFEYRNELYFFARNPDLADPVTAWVLWKASGDSGSGAVLVKSVGFPFFARVDPQFAAELGGPLYFRAWDPEHGFELWKTDGNASGGAGTVLVADIEPGPFSSDPRGLVATGGRVWFSALDRVYGRELWTSDGTAAGTRRVADIAPGGLSSAPEMLTPFAGRLYFSADDGSNGRELWSLTLLNP